MLEAQVKQLTDEKQDLAADKATLAGQNAVLKQVAHDHMSSLSAKAFRLTPLESAHLHYQFLSGLLCPADDTETVQDCLRVLLGDYSECLLLSTKFRETK